MFRASLEATGCHHRAVFAPYCPGSCHGCQLLSKHKKANKTVLLAGDPTVRPEKITSLETQSRPSTQPPDMTNFLKK
jgi:hypothetical protein